MKTLADLVVVLIILAILGCCVFSAGYSIGTRLVRKQALKAGAAVYVINPTNYSKEFIWLTNTTPQQTNVTK